MQFSVRITYNVSKFKFKNLQLLLYKQKCSINVFNRLLFAKLTCNCGLNVLNSWIRNACSFRTQLIDMWSLSCFGMYFHSYFNWKWWFVWYRMSNRFDGRRFAFTVLRQKSWARLTYTFSAAVPSLINASPLIRSDTNRDTKRDFYWL